METDKNISTINEFIEFTTESLDEEWIYRGQGNSSWSLTPSIDRPGSRDIALRTIEKPLLEEFKRRSSPYVEQDLTSDWE